MPIVPIHRHPQPATSPVPAVNPRPRIRPIAAQQPAPTPPNEPERKVGYKSPPLHTRLQKGRSGNPRGRPKGVKVLRTMVREILTQKVSVRTPQGAKRMTKMEAMLHKILEQAFSGNVRALQAFIKLYEAAVPDEPVASGTSGQSVSEQTEPAAISAHDQAILDKLRASLVAELGEAQRTTFLTPRCARALSDRSDPLPFLLRLSKHRPFQSAAPKKNSPLRRRLRRRSEQASTSSGRTVQDDQKPL